MGTVVEPPHPGHPVGTVGRAKRDPLSPPPPPTGRPRTLRRDASHRPDPVPPPSRIPVLGFRVRVTPSSPRIPGFG